MRKRLIALLQHPFAPLLPWGGIAIGLFVALIFVQSIGLADLQAKRQRVEAEWGTALYALPGSHDIQQ